MSSEQFESILNNVLLALQLWLGLWQFLKLTPLGALVKGVVGYWLLRPLGLSPTYTGLLRCKGRVIKEVALNTTTAEDQHTEHHYDDDRLEWLYLGVKYVIERRDGNKLFINGQMSYYITDRSWQNVSSIPAGGGMVFIKKYREFWNGVATGGVMNLTEVLDRIILDNHGSKVLRSQYLLLPVDLSASEEKLLKILNMAGLFFLAKKVHWPIPTFFSLTSAILEFSSPVRTRLYSKFNFVFCCAMHRIIDQFSYSRRRQMYSLGNWVENLNPSNNIESRVVRGNISVVVAGGAKTRKEDAALLPHDYFSGQQREFLLYPGGQRQYLEGSQRQHHQPEELDDLYFECTFNCGNLVITLFFRQRFGYVHWTDGFENSDQVEYLEFDISREECMKVCTFISYVTKNQSGSLRSSGLNNRRVRVRGLKESLLCYVKSGFPPVYELEFLNVVVN